MDDTTTDVALVESGRPAADDPVLDALLAEEEAIVADPEIEVDPATVVDGMEELRRLDPVYMVEPGEDSGWGQYVMQCLGLGIDSTVYDEPACELVRELQAANDLEPDGIVSGLTWAYVLPEIAREDARGLTVTILRRLLGLKPGGAWDAAVSEKLAELDLGSDFIDRHSWRVLIAEFA